MVRRAAIVIGCWALPLITFGAGRGEPTLSPPFALPFGAIAGDPASLDAIASGSASDARRSLVLLVDQRTHAVAAVRAAVARAFDAWRTNANGALADAQARLPEPSASSLAWLVSFVPTLVIDAVEQELSRRPHSVDDATFAIDVVDVFAQFERVDIAPRAMWSDLCAADTPVGQIGRRALCRPDWRTVISGEDEGALEPVNRIREHWNGNWHSQESRRTGVPRWPIREAAEFTELARLVDRVLATSDTPGLLRAVVEPSSTNPPLRAYVEQKLIPLLGDRGTLGDEAAFVLAHMGCTLPALKARFVATLDSIEDLDAAAWERVPCLTEHDDSTRAAMRRLFERSKSPWELLSLLVQSGSLADPDDEFAVNVIARLDSIASAGAWRDAYDAGLRWRYVTGERDAPIVILEKVAIAWNAPGTTDHERELLRRRFEDAALQIDGYGGYLSHPSVVWPWLATDLGIRTPRLIDRAITLATTDASSGYAIDSLCEYLATCDLNTAQRQKLCADLSVFAAADQATKLFVTFGDGALSRVPMMRERMRDVLERSATSARWSIPAESDALELLESILAFAGPSEDDRNLLAGAVRYGQLEQRLQAVRIIVKFQIEGPTIAAVLERAREDLEPRVRAAALVAGH